MIDSEAMCVSAFMLIGRLHSLIQSDIIPSPHSLLLSHYTISVTPSFTPITTCGWEFFPSLSISCEYTLPWNVSTFLLTEIFSHIHLQCEYDGRISCREGERSGYTLFYSDRQSYLLSLHRRRRE